MDHAAKAKELFDRGYNCCQSVLMAYAEETGLDAETAARIAGTFGGGMGKTGSVCGCVAAMCMVEGLRSAPVVPDKAAQREANAGYRENAKASRRRSARLHAGNSCPRRRRKGPARTEAARAGSTWSKPRSFWKARGRKGNRPRRRTGSAAERRVA